MFQIIDFEKFKAGVIINEGLGSNVFKIDPDKPDSPEQLGKFSFTLKVQHPEGSSDPVIAGLLAKQLDSQLQASSGFMNVLNQTKGIPVIFTRRNTTGGFLTGERGVMVGSIVILNPNSTNINALQPFKIAGTDVEAKIGNQIIYDGESAGQVITGSSSQTNFNPNAAVITRPGNLSPTDKLSRIAELQKSAIAALEQIKVTNSSLLQNSPENAQKLEAAITELKNTKPEDVCKNPQRLVQAKSELADAGKVLNSVMARAFLNDAQQSENKKSFEILERDLAEILSICGSSDQGPITQGQQPSGKQSGSTKAKQDDFTKDDVINGLMELTFNTSSNQIKTLNSCLIVLDPSLMPTLVEDIYKKDDDGKDTKDKDGLDISDTYNDSTAIAIQKVLGKTSPVKQITKDIATELANKVIPITKKQLAELTLSVRTGSVNPQMISGKPNPVKLSGDNANTAKTLKDKILQALKGLKTTNASLLQMDPAASQKLDTSISEIEKMNPEDACSNSALFDKAKADLAEAKAKLSQAAAFLTPEQKSQNEKNFQTIETSMADLMKLCSVASSSMSQPGKNTTPAAAGSTDLPSIIEKAISGLKKPSKSPAVAVLQLTVAAISPEAAKLIKKSNIKVTDGIDSIYGNGTSKAVGSVLGVPAGIPSITPEIAKIIAEKVKALGAEALAKLAEKIKLKMPNLFSGTAAPASSQTGTPFKRASHTETGADL
jgi:hypothetical protein